MTLSWCGELHGFLLLLACSQRSAQSGCRCLCLCNWGAQLVLFMRISFALAIVINVLILLGYSVKTPSASLGGDFGTRSHFPDGVGVGQGSAPLAVAGVSRAITLLGYIQTALCSLATLQFLTGRAMPIIRSG